MKNLKNEIKKITAVASTTVATTMTSVVINAQSIGGKAAEVLNNGKSQILMFGDLAFVVVMALACIAWGSGFNRKWGKATLIGAAALYLVYLIVTDGGGLEMLKSLVM